MDSTIDEKEISSFNKFEDNWWDETGAFSSLHKITPCRIEYIIQVIRKNIKSQNKLPNHSICSGLNILDVGCGGGILCEPLSKLGGNITGIDASPNAIKIAKKHSKIMNLKINYECGSIEKFKPKQKIFDLIIASEVIEHVANRKVFLDSIFKLSTKQTSIILTTINKSIPGILLGKFAAEYIFSLIPKNTHDWRKFVSPKTLFEEAKNSGILLNNFTGFIPDPLEKKFKLSPYLGVNYAASGILI